MSSKDRRIAAMAGQFREGKHDRHYTGFFELFNRREFFEAHEVLEHIWLKDRQGPNGAFYKGLIQLAGAFVHLQRNRPRPAAALFKLARANFEKYPPTHEHLNLNDVRGLIGTWLADLEQTPFRINPLAAANAPCLKLEDLEA
jgi:predicted metal-dependent hydrolase